MRVSLSIYLPSCPSCRAEEPAVWDADDDEVVECQCGASHHRDEWLANKSYDGAAPMPTA